MIHLPDHDALELAELLEWLTEFFTHTNAELTDTFTAWAAHPTAIEHLTQDLNRWANQLRTTTPT